MAFVEFRQHEPPKARVNGQMKHCVSTTEPKLKCLVVACSTSFVLDCSHRSGIEVMKVMTNKLLSLTFSIASQAVQHCIMQSASGSAGKQAVSKQPKRRVMQWHYASLLLPCVGCELHLWISLQGHKTLKSFVS